MENNELTNKEIGLRITEARTKAGLYKKDVAEMTHLADTTIARYENGDIEKIKMPVIEAIARAVNANPMWIIGKADSPDPVDYSIPLEFSYYSFAKEMQEKKVSKDDMERMWKFYNMLKNL